MYSMHAKRLMLMLFMYVKCIMLNVLCQQRRTMCYQAEPKANSVDLQQHKTNDSSICKSVYRSLRHHVHVPALLIQQVKESSCFHADQLNAAAVVSAADILPSDALGHIILLEEELLETVTQSRKGYIILIHLTLWRWLSRVLVRANWPVLE